MAESIPETWRYLAASVVGSSHLAQNLPCQDAHATAILDDGTLIVAVADGAGSAKRSYEGARRAVESSTQCLIRDLRAAQPVTAQDCEALLEKAVVSARAALQEIAPGEEFNEVATTLLLTIVTPLWLSTIQVGDGAVISRHVSGSLRVLSQLGQSEYINETTSAPLTKDGAQGEPGAGFPVTDIMAARCPTCASARRRSACRRPAWRRRWLRGARDLPATASRRARRWTPPIDLACARR